MHNDADKESVQMSSIPSMYNPARCGALRHVGRLAHEVTYCVVSGIASRVLRLQRALRVAWLRVAASIALRRCRDLKMTLDNYARMPALVASMLATTTTKTNKQHIIPKAHHEKPKAHLG